MNFTVTDTGSAQLSGWTVAFDLPPRQSAQWVWEAKAQQIGQKITASAYGYNSQLTPGGSAQWGLIVSGSGQPATTSDTPLTCTAESG